MADGAVNPTGSPKRVNVSVVVITWNEDRNIRECLESAQWMDEIIVVDALSQDRTLEICREYTQRIFTRPWKGFGDQKNFAIDQATSDWVFILDADERISPELRKGIETVLLARDRSGPLAFYLPRRNYYYGRWLRWGGTYPDYQLRLFRRGVGKLNDAEPHNRFLFEGPSAHLQVPLDHFTERTISDHFKKFNNFTTLAARERGRHKQTVYWTDLAMRPTFTFWKYYVARQGFRDGMHGFLIAVFASMYTFVKYAKLWESLQERKSTGQESQNGSPKTSC